MASSRRFKRTCEPCWHVSFKFVTSSQDSKMGLTAKDIIDSSQLQVKTSAPHPQARTTAREGPDEQVADPREGVLLDFVHQSVEQHDDYNRVSVLQTHVRGSAARTENDSIGPSAVSHERQHNRLLANLSQQRAKLHECERKEACFEG